MKLKKLRAIAPGVVEVAAVGQPHEPNRASWFKIICGSTEIEH